MRPGLTMRAVRTARIAGLRRRLRVPVATLSVSWPFTANLCSPEGVPAELVMCYTLPGGTRVAVVTQRKMRIGMWQDDIVSAADTAWSTAWPGRRFGVPTPIEVHRDWTAMTDRPRSRLIVNGMPLTGPMLEHDGCRAVAVDAGKVNVACAGPPEVVFSQTLVVR